MKTLIGIPCLGCEYIERCGSHHDINPETCMKLTAWIEAEVKGEAGVKAEAEPKGILQGLPICPVCGKPVRTDRGLKIHITRVHGKKEAKGDEQTKIS